MFSCCDSTPTTDVDLKRVAGQDHWKLVLDTKLEQLFIDSDSAMPAYLMTTL